MSLKSVYSAPSQTQATIIRNLLQNAGIEAALRTDDANGNIPSLDVSEGVDVLVDESMAGEALAVLEEYRNGETAIDENHAD
ncbi:MAG: putative prokaryotic signal transducing protein [Fibrobacteres bacterium]|nr:putative prokaryotic signal transducing protein [Fibrobacterota bacterium]